jgi:putative hydrolase of the HAD superfamily
MTDLLDRQQLLFDADDTLWENNVHFERGFEEFVSFLNHERLSTQEIREVLDRFERVNISNQLYGARAFANGLAETYQEITGSRDDAELAAVQQFGLRILEIEMDLIDGVEETLNALRPHHDLFLITKGDLEEQQLKINRSAISGLFDAHVITREKRTDTYRDIVDSLDLERERTWMIGNSTRSDIHPALEAGLHAVLIPHDMTWHLEHIEFERHPDWAGRFVELQRFRDLTTLFRHGREA